MGSVVRRVNNSLARSNAGNEGIQQAGEFLAPVTRHKDALTVTSLKNIGVDPHLLLSWSVRWRYWADGYRLMGFRSASGFAPEEHPEQLSAHGQMILEETADGTLEERLPEGTHFYTFVLYKRTLFGLRERMTVLRFSETIPSAKTAIGRIEDQIALQQLKERHELNLITDQVAKNEAIIALHRSNQKLAALTQPKADDSLEEQVRRDVEAVVKKKMKKAMTRVELVAALQDVEKRLKRIPAWKKLGKAQRDRLLQEIVGDLDAEEEFFQP